MGCAFCKLCIIVRHHMLGQLGNDEVEKNCDEKTRQRPNWLINLKVIDFSSLILKLIWSCVFDSVPVKHRWRQEECGKCETETRKSESRWFLKEFFWNLARNMDQYVLCIFLFGIFLHTSYFRKTYIHASYIYLRACIPQCKHKRQHLSSGHWRRLQSYRTKDCQRHNGLLKSHITSWSQFSIRILMVLFYLFIFFV